MEMQPPPSSRNLLFDHSPPVLLGLKITIITSYKAVTFYHGTEFLVVTPLQKKIKEIQVLSVSLH